MLALVVVTALLLVWALVSGRLARWSVTAPFALLAAGVLLTAGPDPVFIFDIPPDAAERVVEVILAILLFTDATEVPGSVLRRQRPLVLRLLLIALPLSLLLAWLVGFVLLNDLSLWLLALLATIVMPTDMAPAISFVKDRRIPDRLRQVLNAESGLNDGIVAPVFLFCLAGATAAGEDDLQEAAVDAVPSLVLAVLVGALVGWIAARVLHRSLAAGWTQPATLRLGVLALPLLSYAGAVVIGGNGFVAAFIAGIFFAPEASRLPHDALHLVEDAGALLSLMLWFIFGALVNETIANGLISWSIVAYAALVLTVARMLPVALSLAGTDVSVPDRLFLGWVGPRGIATLVFGLLAFVDLESHEADLVITIMVVTVVGSIVLHGLSTGLVGRWYGGDTPTPPAHRTPEPGVASTEGEAR